MRIHSKSSWPEGRTCCPARVRPTSPPAPTPTKANIKLPDTNTINQIPPKRLGPQRPPLVNPSDRLPKILSKLPNPSKRTRNKPRSRYNHRKAPRRKQHNPLLQHSLLHLRRWLNPIILPQKEHLAPGATTSNLLHKRAPCRIRHAGWTCWYAHLLGFGVPRGISGVDC
jgi:hypothetical protein